MYTSVTDNVLIIDGLIGYADDPLRVVSDVSLKARVLALLRLGGMASPAFSQALEVLLQSLLESPHAPAVQEIVAHLPSLRDAVRSAESSDEDWIIEDEEADLTKARAASIHASLRLS